MELKDAVYEYIFSEDELSDEVIELSDMPVAEAYYRLITTGRLPDELDFRGEPKDAEEVSFDGWASEFLTFASDEEKQLVWEEFLKGK